jgi:putative Holliday junction resolvase
MPRNMDGSYGPAALRVQEFVAVLKEATAIPVRTWDERLTSAQAERVLKSGHLRRDQRRAKVDQTAAAPAAAKFSR